MAAKPETEQEAFWRGAFGDEYTERNADERLVEANIALFRRILERAPRVRSIVELGCNRGLNLKALASVDPSLALSAYEINAGAAKLASALGVAQVHCASILDLDLGAIEPSDLAFTKGVLIHIGPDDLERAYAALTALARRYVMVCEYYNPTPVTVSYRGASERLFKRDFAGELMDRHGLTLVDYGFVYHRDPRVPQDDLTWFLMEKRPAS
ncbi:MAG TPA: pseudaminic acid biosynthesis-associated methylase [Caulobacteraceae bacterium]|nr:pseudaminic acid biosynthesis-associated methylase [Caulobacteraceae bacterium]